jgi:hypothetical protein
MDQPPKLPDSSRGLGVSPRHRTGQVARDYVRGKRHRGRFEELSSFSGERLAACPLSWKIFVTAEGRPRWHTTNARHDPLTPCRSHFCAVIRPLPVLIRQRARRRCDLNKTVKHKDSAICCALLTRYLEAYQSCSVWQARQSFRRRTMPNERH